MKLQLQEQIVVIKLYIILLGDTINSSEKLLKFNSSTIYLETDGSIITRGSQQDHVSPIVLDVVQTRLCQGIKRPSLVGSWLQTAPWRVCSTKLYSVNGICTAEAWVSRNPVVGLAPKKIHRDWHSRRTRLFDMSVFLQSFWVGFSSLNATHG